MIIESGLANRNDARIFGQFSQRIDHVVTRFQHRRWMNADDGENILVCFREVDRAAAAFDGSADSDNAGDSRLIRSTQDIVKISAKSG